MSWQHGRLTSSSRLSILRRLLVVAIFYFCLCFRSARAFDYNGRKVCRGLERGLTKVGTAAARYNEYRQRYGNCTYVDGNLELTFLEEADNHTAYNFDFLSNIEEISGYLLIYRVCAKTIPLTNLRVVRGNTKFTYITTAQETFSYSFYVQSNCHRSEFGVEQLLLDNLAEISTGNVHVENNSKLCYVDKVLWEDITASSYTVRDNIKNSKTCAACHSSCPVYDGERRCWGPGPQHCQKFSKVNCAPQCQGSRCYGPNSRECCPQQCAGGCTGPTARNCTACSKFNNNGECVDACPSTRRYDPLTLKNEVDPNGLLAYSTLCVKTCPPFMGEEDGACVKQCAEKTKMVLNGKCVPCDGPCPKRCSGVVEPDYINLKNIEEFRECNIVDGSIIILEASFDDSANESVTFSDLDVLKDVREVTGYVMIISKMVENLDFLRNLEVIRVQEKNADEDALFIAKTSITSLQLRRLREIGESGKVLIEESPTCYVQTMNWTRIIGPNYKDSVILGDQLPTEATCVSLNQTCDPRCSSEGCWGPGNHNCLSCNAYRYGDVCLSSCEEQSQLYDAGNWTCERCHSECAETCSGAGADQCIGGCQHFKWRDVCVADCPVGTYADSENICRQCHPNCQSCVGPSSYMDEDGCTSCSMLTLLILPNISACSNATKCPAGFYPTDNLNCRECDWSCRDGCYGSTKQDCFACKNFKVYEEDSTKFTCVDACPTTHPHEVIDPNNKQEAVCSAFPPVSTALILGVSIPVVLLVIGGIVFGVICWRKRETTKAERTRLAAQLTGIDETQPLDPNGQAPDMSQLLLIDESELEIGKAIGNGAFGTVYRGRWKPRNDPNSEPIAVAIKILQDGPFQIQQAELLQEARVMASVNYLYCLRLFGLCLAERVQLVTGLMPFGSLIEYVRKNRNTRQLCSRHFATWSLQIAKGMAYLEDKGIVHRDLAARNVLLQRPFLAKITDFGLAKLLGEEPIYESKGGKMPIKWLAIESIEQRIFTSRSDVWSYGVTLWEVFTYGQKPYEVYRARDIPELIHRGNRLEQPAICSIDVYTIMLQCWMHNPAERPSFKDLVERFMKVSADPPRYFVIEGDRFMRQPSMDQHRHDEEEWLSQLETFDESGEFPEDPEDVFDQSSTDILRDSAGSFRPVAAAARLPISSNDYNSGELMTAVVAQATGRRPQFFNMHPEANNEYEQPSTSYSVPRQTPESSSVQPPPLPVRTLRRKSNQSAESMNSNSALAPPVVNRKTTKRSESSSSGASQLQSNEQVNMVHQMNNKRERLSNSNSNASSTAPILPMRPGAGHQQASSRKHTTSNASSTQTNAAEHSIDMRATQRLAAVSGTSLSPLVGADKRVSSMYQNPPPGQLELQQSFGELASPVDAFVNLPRTPLGKGSFQMPPISTSPLPMQNGAFQYPNLPTPPVHNGLRSPMVEDGEPYQLSKVAALPKNGYRNGDVAMMAMNPDYFVLPDVTNGVRPQAAPNNGPVNANANVNGNGNGNGNGNVNVNGNGNGNVNGKRRSDRRPPNLDLLRSDIAEYTNDVHPSRVRSPKVEELSSLASPATVQMLSGANASSRPNGFSSNYYNTDAYANLNGNGKSEVPLKRLGLAIPPNGAMAVNGKMLIVAPLQDSKV